MSMSAEDRLNIFEATGIVLFSHKHKNTTLLVVINISAHTLRV